MQARSSAVDEEPGSLCSAAMRMLLVQVYLAVPNNCPYGPEGKKRKLSAEDRVSSSVLLYISEDEGLTFTEVGTLVRGKAVLAGDCTSTRPLCVIGMCGLASSDVAIAAAAVAATSLCVSGEAACPLRLLQVTLETSTTEHRKASPNQSQLACLAAGMPAPWGSGLGLPDAQLCLWAWSLPHAAP